MAVKACAPVVLESGVAAALPQTTAINGSTDTITITGGNDADKLLIVIENSTAGSKKATIKAAVTNPAGVRKGLGDLVITLAEKTTQVVAIESARFVPGKEGPIELSFEAAMTGFVSAIRIPKAL